MSRQLDAEIAQRLMGLEVLGEVFCETDPEYGTLEVPYEALPEGQGTLSPVYLRKCVCDDILSDVYPEDSKYFDHYASCLEPVLHYSTHPIHTKKVIEEMKKQGWNFGCSNGQSEGPECYADFDRTDDDRDGEGHADTLEEATCLAAIGALNDTEPVKSCDCPPELFTTALLLQKTSAAFEVSMRALKEAYLEIHMRHSEHWIKDVTFEECDTRRCTEGKLLLTRLYASTSEEDDGTSHV